MRLCKRPVFFLSVVLFVSSDIRIAACGANRLTICRQERLLLYAFTCSCLIRFLYWVGVSPVYCLKAVLK